MTTILISSHDYNIFLTEGMITTSAAHCCYPRTGDTITCKVRYGQTGITKILKVQAIISLYYHGRPSVVKLYLREITPSAEKMKLSS